MKLQQDIVDYIYNAIKTADIVNVENIIIEPNMIRSMNDARTVGLFTSDNVPDMPFKSIGITRIHDLMSRFSVAKDLDGFNIEVATNEHYATKFVLKSKGLRIDYRCGDPRKITAPKALNDTECFSVALTPEAVRLYQKGLAAMNAENVSIVSNEGVSFEFSDIANDIYSYTFADNAELIPNENGEVESSTKFAHQYPAKTLLALFKNNPEAKFTISKRGMMRFPLNDLMIFVLPKV